MRSRSCLVQAVAAGTEREHHQHAAADRDVLPEVDLVGHLLRGVGEIPVVVEEDARGEREDREHERGPARLEADREQEAAAKLADDRDDGADLRQGQVLGGDVADRALEAADLAETGRDEDEGQHDAPDERRGVLHVGAEGCRWSAVGNRVHGISPWGYRTRSNRRISAARPPSMRMAPSGSQSFMASPAASVAPFTFTSPRATCRYTSGRRGLNSIVSLPSTSPA